MAHDPKAQDVIVAEIAEQEQCECPDGEPCSVCTYSAAGILTALANAGLCVVSDAAEPADAEQRYEAMWAELRGGRA